jgi:protein-S-isoprenylcysteine O-methyltransferase Ste14
MRKSTAWFGSFVFLAAAPGMVAGVIPYAIFGGYPSGLAAPALVGTGFVLVAAGLSVLLHAFARFVIEGVGTPAPVAPTQQLVVGGIYRFVRNPMYLSVIAIILGQVLIFGSWPLLLYCAAASAVMALFVHFYEEPTLTQTYGDTYRSYCRAVPGWLPRLTPWNGD